MKGADLFISRVFGVCAAVCVGAFAMPASAQSPVAYNGRYELTCLQAELALHLDLGAMIAGVSSSFSGNLITPLDCDGVSAEEASLFQEQLTAQCLSSGLSVEMCAPLAEDITAAVSEFNEDALGLLPQSVTMSVQSIYSFWNQVFGIYPMLGWHSFADGSSQSLTYVLNRNTGDFGVAGVQLLNSGATGQLGCADIAVGGISGRIAPSAGLLSASFSVDRSLYCAASYGPDLLLGSFGLSFRGQASGQK